jgi:hypothetical protein
MRTRNNALLKTPRACVIDVKADAQIPSEGPRDKAEHKPKQSFAALGRSRLEWRNARRNLH